MGLCCSCVNLQLAFSVFLVFLNLLELHIMSNDDPDYRFELTVETRPETGALTLINPWISLNDGWSLSPTSCSRTASLVVTVAPECWNLCKVKHTSNLTSSKHQRNRANYYPLCKHDTVNTMAYIFVDTVHKHILSDVNEGMFGFSPCWWRRLQVIQHELYTLYWLTTYYAVISVHNSCCQVQQLQTSFFKKFLPAVNSI